jgi:hypothetical protein
MESKALSPVSATITSYGRSSKIFDEKINRTTTLYIICVTKGSKKWYVARRYSEFRTLHEQLCCATNNNNKNKTVTTVETSCLECRMLHKFCQAYHFPSKYSIQSIMGFWKNQIDSARMEALNEYLRHLLIGTQGLVNNEEDHCIECSGAALRLLRSFLLVKDDNEEEEGQTGPHTKCKMKNKNKHQLTKSMSVSEMDIFYKKKTSSISNNSSIGSSCGTAFSSEDFDEIFQDDFYPPSEEHVIRLNSIIESNDTTHLQHQKEKQTLHPAITAIQLGRPTRL